MLEAPELSRIDLFYTSDWEFNCRDSSQAIFAELKQARSIKKVRIETA